MSDLADYKNSITTPTEQTRFITVSQLCDDLRSTYPRPLITEVEGIDGPTVGYISNILKLPCGLSIRYWEWYKFPDGTPSEVRFTVADSDNSEEGTGWQLEDGSVMVLNEDDDEDGDSLDAEEIGDIVSEFYDMSEFDTSLLGVDEYLDIDPLDLPYQGEHEMRPDWADTSGRTIVERSGMKRHLRFWSRWSVEVSADDPANTRFSLYYTLSDKFVCQVQYDKLAPISAAERIITVSKAVVVGATRRNGLPSDVVEFFASRRRLQARLIEEARKAMRYA